MARRENPTPSPTLCDASSVPKARGSLLRASGSRPAETERTGEMGKVIVMNGLTLDGVMQGPGRPDEDTRDGFAHGGWAAPYSDEAMAAKMGERMGEGRAFLFGRRTYEDLLTSWNAQGGPFKEALNNARKYVASSNPATRLDWPNSTLLHGDIPAAVADLKESSGTNGRRSDRRVPAHDPSYGARHRAAAV